MELDKALKKIIVSKPFGLAIVKGSQNSGKTEIAACRALYLKSSYCLYEDEKVLVVANNSDNSSLVRKLYDETKNQLSYDYSTLFSMFREEPVEFFALKEIIDKYYSLYIQEKGLRLNLIDEKERLDIIRDIIKDLKDKYKRIKFIRDCSEEFILKEIDWIKSTGIASTEDYKIADRHGRKVKGDGSVRLAKNSKARELVFEIMLLYNEELQAKNMIDEIDKEKVALEFIKNNGQYYYTHMIIDDAHELTKIQLQLLMALKSKKAYSSMMLMADHKAEGSKGAWITKGRKQKELGFDMTIKNFYLKKTIAKQEEKSVQVKSTERSNQGNVSMEKYTFMDIRHKKTFEFIRDTANQDELILNLGDKDLSCSKDELETLPVYSNIAAGEPIAMDPEMVDTFNIPQYWIKGMKDCFMLKVKGDSMIGAAIDDGDFVVIRRQSTASNRDIVAVDLEGNATLKRLWMDQKEALLMPENEKYAPIQLKDREAIILGVVVGIIKPAA